MNRRCHELNETNIFNQRLTLCEIISSTGIQIKTDPGIPMIYLGFLFLMLSTLISYITYSQVWIIQKGQKLSFFNSNSELFFMVSHRFRTLAQQHM